MLVSLCPIPVVAAEGEAQLTAIDGAKGDLTDEENDRLDLIRYQAAATANPFTAMQALR